MGFGGAAAAAAHPRDSVVAGAFTGVGLGTLAGSGAGAGATDGLLTGTEVAARFAAWAANSAAGLGTGGGAGCTIPDAVGATGGAEKPPGTNAGAVALGTKDCAPTLRPPLGLGTKVLAPGRKTKELAVALSFVDLVDFTASSPPSDMCLCAPVCYICVRSLRCPTEEARTRSTSEVLLCKRWPRGAEDPGEM